MGNQPSSSGSGGPRRDRDRDTRDHQQHNPRRRESIPALSVKSTAAPPSASLESAHARSASARPATPTLPTSTASAVQNTVQNKLRDSADKMGNEQSRTHDKGSKESKASKARSTPSSSEKPSPALPSQSQPVDVPAPRDDPPPAPPKIDAPFSPSSPLPVEYFVPPAQFARPPRLPLPIEEEVHTPGSPIISPEELVDPDGTLPRRTSLSSTVADEDEDEGDELSAPQNGPTVPTLIEWEGRGEKVYVTGTFVNWERKFRLYKNGPSKKKDVLSAIVNITPGTHHLKFLVDGEMTASDKLPTAVDYTNILVNYLEVSLDHLTKPPADAKDATSQPEPTPVQEQRAPPGVYPPLVLPPTPELFPAPPKQTGDSAQPAPTPPLSKYHSVIPRYLRDLDSDENSSRYQRASAVTNEPEALPAPPTLPMFLNKSILNGATPMKDDSSVLNLPNHTVLNHLATSSIKDNILATSATTRYKQKFLTTIMYKPKSEERERECH